MHSLKASNSKKYKSVVAENKARNHYNRNMRKLYLALREFDIKEFTCYTNDNRRLYWLCDEIWNYWEDGFITPLFLYGIEIETIENGYKVSLS